MKCATTPFFRGNVGDGFGEIPTVAIEILGIVLALAVRVVLRFRQNDGPILARALTMSIGIVDADLNGMRMIGRHITFSNGEATLAGLHLYAVIGDAEAYFEAESLCQPIGR